MPKRTSSVNGTLVDVQGGPVAQAKVWLEAVDLSAPHNNLASYLAFAELTTTFTDSAGFFSREVAPGRYHVVAEREGYVRVRQPVLVTDGADAQVRMVLPPPTGQSIIAHRGASLAAPENTIAAFRKAVAMGVDAVEMDLRLSRDGHVVVIHDDNVNRTTNGTGRVRFLTLTQLQQLDAGSWFGSGFGDERIPTLREALLALRNAPVRIFLDLKSHEEDFFELERATRLTVDELGLGSRVVYASFYQHSNLFCAAAADQHCGYIMSQTAGEDPLSSPALNKRWRSLLVPRALMNGFRLQSARDNEQAVYVWTVNDPISGQRYLREGVDGLITDTPAQMMDILAAWAHRSALRQPGSSLLLPAQ